MKIRTSVPISHRFDKWRMWHLPNGYWIAAQPIQTREPMFTNNSLTGRKWPTFQYVNRDPKRVLHELQLAMAKAAA